MCTGVWEKFDWNLAIEPRAYQPSSLLTIEPIDHKAYLPSSLLTSGLLLGLLSILACFQRFMKTNLSGVRSNEN